MSQFGVVAASSSYRNGHMEDIEQRYGHSKEQTEKDKQQTKAKEQRSKRDTWLGIYVVTQFWVICLAVVVFLGVVYACATKLSDRLTLETKDRVSQSHTWFKLAICLRPFMTGDLLNELYALGLNKSFTTHVNSLDISDEEKYYFNGTFYFDNQLDPQLYQYYFKHVHPWKVIPPHILWDFQSHTLRTAFEEFQVNDISTGITKKDLPKGNRADLEKYTILPPPNTGNTSEDRPLMLGEYALSPLYMGCLSMTVTEEMAEKQMEISIKFKPSRAAFVTDEKKITTFESADIFVYDKDDTFTEIPTIKKHAKFSVMATSRERLSVSNSKYVRQRSSRRNCEMAEIDSEALCRQSCEFRELLEEINCTLPWMERFRQHTQLLARYDNLSFCSDLDSFLETVKIEDDYMSNIKIMDKEKVQECLLGCTESCKSSQVRIHSLGSKSIGSNYGVTLTMSPAVDVVREHFSYSVANMISELCASVSFLLGLSAIAIYDWLVAFGIWVSIKLGLYVPEQEEGGSAGGGGGHWPVAVPGLPTRSKGEPPPSQPPVQPSRSGMQPSPAASSARRTSQLGRQGADRRQSFGGVGGDRQSFAGFGRDRRQSSSGFGRDGQSFGGLGGDRRQSSGGLGKDGRQSSGGLGEDGRRKVSLLLPDDKVELPANPAV